MEFSSIKTFIVGPDKIVRPKNPYHHGSALGNFTIHGNNELSAYSMFEKEAQQHHYAVDESLTPGEYDADKLELVWQRKSLFNEDWFNESEIEHNITIGFNKGATNGEEKYITRQVLKLKQPESPKFGEWISVKDRLPEICPDTHCSGVYLVYSDGLIFQARLVDFGKEKIWSPVLRCYINHSASHWMPLPSPPKSK